MWNTCTTTLATDKNVSLCVLSSSAAIVSRVWFNRTYWFGGSCDWFCRWCGLFMSTLSLKAMFTLPSLESYVDKTLWKLSVGEAISVTLHEGLRTSWTIEICPGCRVEMIIGFGAFCEWLLVYVTALYGGSTVCDWFGGVSTGGVLPPLDQRCLKKSIILCVL